MTNGRGLIAIAGLVATLAASSFSGGLACRADAPHPPDEEPALDAAAGGGSGRGGRGGAGGAGGRADAAPADHPVGGAPDARDAAAPDRPPDAPPPTCGLTRLPCCAGNACAFGGCCICGQCVQNGTACTAEATCLSGSCGGCGGLMQPCCAIAGVDGGPPQRVCTTERTVCTGTGAGRCQRCGGTGEPCCANDFCAGATACCGSDHHCVSGSGACFGAAGLDARAGTQ